ncbi:23558_t:CDS:1, partial [Dentiscutata erythropus]
TFLNGAISNIAAAYTNGIDLTNRLVSMPNTHRGLYLAMRQVSYSLNPALQQYILENPMLTNVPAINNSRLQGQDKWH